MMLKLLLTAVLAAGCCAAACFPVTANRITGRDLALADPEFAAVPATWTVAVAPEPGMRRTFAAAELERIASMNHIPFAHPRELCFEIPMRKPGMAEIESAMRRVLSPAADLKIVEASNSEMPAGEIEFALNGLEPATLASGGAQLWRGYVRYAEMRKAPVWARVILTEHYKAVVATRDLPPNTVIAASAIRLEERTGTPAHEKFAARLEEVAGRQTTRAIKAGDPIASALLIPAWDVKRGDSIRVEVRSGDARLALQAIAEAPARDGDLVQLRNPSSGKVFRARLEQSGRAVLVVGYGPGL